MQSDALSKLIGDWDGKDPASPQSTALLLVLLELAERIRILEAQIAEAKLEALRKDDTCQHSPWEDQRNEDEATCVLCEKPIKRGQRWVLA